MSYTILRSLSARDGKVFVTAKESNVFPKEWRRYEAPALTKIYRKEGMEEVEVVLLADHFRWGDPQFAYGSRLDKLAFLASRHRTFRGLSQEGRAISYEDMKGLIRSIYPSVLRKYARLQGLKGPWVLKVPGRGYFASRMRLGVGYRYSRFLYLAQQFPNLLEALYTRAMTWVPSGTRPVLLEKLQKREAA